MTDPIEHRVIKLELRVDNHADELKQLQETSKDLSNSLRAIETTLVQIKWLVIGGGIVLFAREFGLDKLLGILL